MSDETPHDDAEASASPKPEPEAAEPPPAAEPLTAAEAPTQADTTPVRASADEDEVEAPAPAAATAPSRPGFFVPRWAALLGAAIVAALVFGGIGYAIGHSSSDNGNNSRNAGALPSFGNGNNPFGKGNGPFGGRGNGPFGDGESERGAFLGVSVENADNGARITGVRSGSPAATAGLKTGDVITKVGDDTVGSAPALAKAVRAHSSGDEVTITYTRDGTSSTVKVTLGSRSSIGQSS